MIINLIGSYPPPYGGIAVHIQRLYLYLRSMGVAAKVFTFSDTLCRDMNIQVVPDKIIWVFKLVMGSLFARNTIYHSHCIALKDRLLIGFMGFLGRKVVLTIHGDGLYDQLVENKVFKLNRIEKFLLMTALKNITCFIAVNHKISGFLVSIGINEEKIAVIPAFLPPSLEETEEFSSSEFERFYSKGGTIFCLNANRPAIYEGHDLYGIDLSIELCRQLIEKGRDVRFICSMGSTGNEAESRYFDSLQAKIINSGLTDNYLLLKENLPFCPILKNCDVFLRPTNTDGDSISVREAIFMKKIVIASDVVDRPSGVLTFKSRDSEDLLRAAIEVMDDLAGYRAKARGLKQENYTQEVYELYKRILR